MLLAYLLSHNKWASLSTLLADHIRYNLLHPHCHWSSVKWDPPALDPILGLLHKVGSFACEQQSRQRHSLYDFRRNVPAAKMAVSNRI
jgi:hypothetical protein